MAGTLSTSVYCSNEDLLVAAPGDYRELMPVSQMVARAKDGVFAAVAGGSWVLQSATVPFLSYAVAAGHVTILTGPVSAFPTPEAVIIESVTSGSVTLRRLSLPAGMGQPPGPVAGATGVGFMIGTFYPQIERASYDVRKALGMDDGTPGLSTADLYDARELQQATIALVLARQYRDMARQAGKDQDFWAKAKAHQADFDQIIQRTKATLVDGTVGTITAPRMWVTR